MIAIALAALAAAQAPPALLNANVDTRSASSGLAPTIRAILTVQPQPAWIAWAVPTTTEAHMCCFDSVEKGESSRWCCGGCRLEGRGKGTFTTSRKAGAIPLEPSKTMSVLLRVEQGRISQARAYSSDCALDAGGRPVHWLDGVEPAESVALLAGLASTTPPLPTGAGFEAEEALVGLAQHDEPSVDPALERLAAAGPMESREQAVFWMGQARGRRGYDSLTRILREEKSDELREHVVFSLSQSDVPEAVDAMIDAAKHDRSSEVRGQSLFWLSQKAGRRAAAAITDAIRDDPDTEVKEKAVFALSQLPPDEGVPQLIRLARTHRNPAVREKAMFWLGQSEDPRALGFFEEVLAR
jgi:HEAT repeats